MLDFAGDFAGDLTVGRLVPRPLGLPPVLGLRPDSGMWPFSGLLT
jgi:hypothetical protein